MSETLRGGSISRRDFLRGAVKGAGGIIAAAWLLGSSGSQETPAAQATTDQTSEATPDDPAVPNLKVEAIDRKKLWDRTDDTVDPYMRVTAVKEDGSRTAQVTGPDGEVTFYDIGQAGDPVRVEGETRCLPVNSLQQEVILEEGTTSVEFNVSCPNPPSPIPPPQTPVPPTSQ